MNLVKANAVALTRERYTTTPKAKHVEPPRAEVSDESTLIESLQARISDLENLLAKTRQSRESEEAAAYERGVKEGHQKASEALQRSQDKQLNILKQAIQGAASRFDETLNALLPLSIDLAEAAVSRIIDEPSHYAELIARTVDRQCRGLASDAVLSIDVSAEDFPSEAHIEQFLGEIKTRHGLTITTKMSAAAGTCTIRLTMGRIDADLKAQRQRLATVFDELRDHG